MSGKTILKRNRRAVNGSPRAAPASADDAMQPPDARPRENSHYEWLLDESLRETFPASDPISPAITPETKRS